MDPRCIQVQKATLNRKKTVRDVERLNRHRWSWDGSLLAAGCPEHSHCLRIVQMPGDL